MTVVAVMSKGGRYHGPQGIVRKVVCRFGWRVDRRQVLIRSGQRQMVDRTAEMRRGHIISFCRNRPAS